MSIAKKINLSLEDLQVEFDIDNIISDVEKPICTEFAYKFRYKFYTETEKDSPQFRIAQFLWVVCDFELLHERVGKGYPQTRQALIYRGFSDLALLYHKGRFWG